MKMLISVIVLLKIIETQSLDIVTSTQGKACPDDKRCATRDSCPYWIEKFQELKNLARGTAKDKLVTNMRSSICNKKEKALCCQKEEKGQAVNDSPTYLPVNGECGINPDKGLPKIFGGRKTEPGDFPFAALLGRTVWKRSPEFSRGTRAPNIKVPQWVCGGTLINYWYVVTAAHCTSQLSYVRLGEWTVGGYGSDETSPVDGLPPVQDFKIGTDNIILHEGYRKKLQSNDNDIALIRLPRKPELNLGVQFACLPLSSTAPKAGLSNWNNGLNGQTATVIGWGYTCYQNNSRAFCSTNDENIGSKVQQYLKVPLVRNTVCKDAGLRVTDHHVCAGGEHGKGSCRGDSGGGLYVRKTEYGVDGEVESPWYLLGIVSFGGQACGLGIPDVYTRVSQYTDWIKQNLRT